MLTCELPIIFPISQLDPCKCSIPIHSSQPIQFLDLLLHLAVQMLSLLPIHSGQAHPLPLHPRPLELPLTSLNRLLVPISLQPLGHLLRLHQALDLLPLPLSLLLKALVVVLLLDLGLLLQALLSLGPLRPVHREIRSLERLQVEQVLQRCFPHPQCNLKVEIHSSVEVRLVVLRLLRVPLGLHLLRVALALMQLVEVAFFLLLVLQV